MSKITRYARPSQHNCKNIEVKKNFVTRLMTDELNFDPNFHVLPPYCP